MFTNTFIQVICLTDIKRKILQALKDIRVKLLTGSISHTN